MNTNTLTKIIEGEMRIKEIDHLIVFLNERKKTILQWIEQQPEAKKPKTEEAYSKEFEAVWILYPGRRGVKAEKRAAFNKFKKFKKTDLEDLKKACWNYAKSDNARKGFAKDMVRFLKEDCWRDWINPTQAMLHGGTNPQKSQDKIMEEIVNGN